MCVCVKERESKCEFDKSHVCFLGRSLSLSWQSVCLCDYGGNYKELAKRKKRSKKEIDETIYHGHIRADGRQSYKRNETFKNTKLAINCYFNLDNTISFDLN